MVEEEAAWILCEYLADANVHILSFSLSKFTSDVLQKLGEAINKNQELRILNFRLCSAYPMRRDSWSLFFQQINQLPSLKKLTMAWCELSRGSANFIPALFPNLTFVSLGFNVDESEDDLTAIYDLIIEKCSDLMELTVRNGVFLFSCDNSKTC